MKRRRVLRRLTGGALQNVHFADIVGLAEGFGFRQSRASGSHHVFVHPHVSEVPKLQEVDGEAKPHRVWQLLRFVERSNLRLEDEP